MPHDASIDGGGAGVAAQPWLKDRFARPLRRIAGCSLRRDAEGGIHAAIAVVDAATLAPLDRGSASIALDRESDGEAAAIGACALALAALREAPELLLVDGHGIDHPQRAGLAVRLGLATDLPCIGVATELLVGSSVTALHDMRGAYTPLRDAGTQVGWMLRSLPGHPPLVVSPGHRVAMASVAELVLRFTGNARLPEPVAAAQRMLDGAIGTTGSRAAD